MEKDILFYQEQANEIVSIIQSSTPLAISVRASVGTLCPEIAFITIDALSRKDHPNSIAENSIYMSFKIDFKTNKFELLRSGHVYLSPKDLKTEKYKYMAMRSIVSIAEEKGVNKMRKSKHKDNKITALKLSNYFNTVMKEVITYTGGYPYKQGIEE